MNENSNSGTLTSSTANSSMKNDQIYWINLYFLLRPYVKRWVYSAGISSWLGQEEDVVDDIMQETMLRLFCYTKRAEKGEVAVVRSPEHMIAVIAHNCCRDWQRRDRRQVRFSAKNTLPLDYLTRAKVVDPAEIALDNMFRTWLFEQLSELIAKLPDKQRIALLRDIAGRMYFGSTQSPLQKALSDKGIEVYEYKDWESTDTRESSRNAANLSLALKQVKTWAKETPLQ